jgi:5'-nucleotidase
MRILVTNDDGIFAPGIAALARGLASAFEGVHEVIVVAPLVDHSGASAAVGRVYERESIPYERVDLPGLGHVPTYGIDGTPALATILACIEGFGPRPDLVVSGINLGINAGRSVLHSGTVGATLTGAQFGISGLAVSIGWSVDPVPWETPVQLATDIVPALAAMPAATVLNLNVPSVAAADLRGLRHGTVGRVGLIRSVRPEKTDTPVQGVPVDPTSGSISLVLRGADAEADLLVERTELEPGSDAALLAEGWATLTPLHGVREDRSGQGGSDLAAALATYGVAGRTPGTATGGSGPASRR